MKLSLLFGLFLCGCAAQKSYVQAPSTAKVQSDITAASTSNTQLKSLSDEERTNDRNAGNKRMIIDRWEATHQ